MTEPVEHPEVSLDQSGKVSSRPDPAARRLRMRQFQNRLVDRMQAARGGVDARAGQLGVLIGETRWLIDLQQAGEIVAVGSITGVPLTQPWFLGLTNIRGSLIAVVDHAYFQTGVPTVIDKQSRIIAFAPGLSFNGGLLVSRVLGLRNVADMQPHVEGTAAVTGAGEVAVTDAAAGANAATGVRRRGNHHYIDRDSVVWQTLDLYAVKRDPRFLQVGA